MKPQVLAHGPTKPSEGRHGSYNIIINGHSLSVNKQRRSSLGTAGSCSHFERQKESRRHSSLIPVQGGKGFSVPDNGPRCRSLISDMQVLSSKRNRPLL